MRLFILELFVLWVILCTAVGGIGLLGRLSILVRVVVPFTCDWWTIMVIVTLTLISARFNVVPGRACPVALTLCLVCLNALLVCASIVLVPMTVPLALVSVLLSALTFPCTPLTCPFTLLVRFPVRSVGNLGRLIDLRGSWYDC